MTAAPPAEPPRLLDIVFRRSLTSGRIYVGVGIVFSTLFTISFAATAPSSFGSFVPLILPVYAVIGSMGGLMVFTSDRIKGVFEYLLAYGLSPRRLFANVVVATAALVGLVLTTSLVIGVGVLAAHRTGVTAQLAEGLLLYAVPMSLLAASFAATAGMFWTALSSPREGMNSPIGLVPMVGVGPPVLVLLATEATGSPVVGPIPLGAVAIMAVGVGALLASVGRLLPPERFLSPA